ncbi:uncharacterized protein EKO05_0003929 [Ascochyta rabiei]|uniref:uncharacterized protein n=1 Tax=Didymella rabiei TaxID=5454 RepID=UPI0021FB2544|nr:uncharacterized protein EKO05_0003929 [Ascochyta rabiei]UPX13421.1 hypothetical protein EKO05_0003929 [Ascochyta rabiei]
MHLELGQADHRLQDQASTIMLRSTARVSFDIRCSCSSFLFLLALTALNKKSPNRHFSSSNKLVLACTMDSLACAHKQTSSTISLPTLSARCKRTASVSVNYLISPS